jgi:hypothetical protein
MKGRKIDEEEENRGRFDSVTKKQWFSISYGGMV